MTKQQKLQIADEIDTLEIGQGVEFSTGHYVERVSEYSYEVDGTRGCFIEAYDLVTA